MRRHGWLWAIACSTVLLSAAIAWAGDSDFNRVVKAMETRYGIHHTRIPFVGLVLKFYHPDGIHALKLATFENLDGKVQASAADLDAMVTQNLGGNWRPLVRDISRRGEESTVIYADASSNRVKLLIVSIERDEATIVKMDATEEGLQKLMDRDSDESHGSLSSAFRR
jgi:hypothetical protein